MNEEKKSRFQLTMKFEDQRVETVNSDSVQQLICSVLQHFECFSDDPMPIHCEYNQAGQLCFWELFYGGEFPKDSYPQISGQPELVHATINSLRVRPVTTYPLAKDIEIRHRRYVWARVEDGVVTDWRDFEAHPDPEVKKREMIKELGVENARVVKGEVRGRTLHVLPVPRHLRTESPSKL